MAEQNDTIQIQHVKPEEFGLEAKEAKTIQDMFQPMLDKMVDLEKDYNKIVKKKITEDTIKEAKQLLKEYKKVRIGTSKIHAKMKSYFLKGGRFVDNWKNLQIRTAGHKEDRLREIANYHKIQEDKRKEELKNKRLEILETYAIMPDGSEIQMPSEESLKTMTDEVFKAYRFGLAIKSDEMRKKIKKEEEAKKEEERKAKIANERLKILLPFQFFIQDERKENGKKLISQLSPKELGEMTIEEFSEYWKRAENLKISVGKKMEAERKAREAAEIKLKKEREAAEIKLKKEREAQKKIKILFNKRFAEIAKFLSYVKLETKNLGILAEKEYQALYTSAEKAAKAVMKEEAQIEAKRKMEAEKKMEGEIKLKAKKEAEERAKKEELKRNANDRDGLEYLKSDLISIRRKPYNFDSIEAVRLFDRVNESLDMLIEAVRKQLHHGTFTIVG